MVMVDSEWEDCSYRIETANLLENIADSLVGTGGVCVHMWCIWCVVYMVWGVYGVGCIWCGVYMRWGVYDVGCI